MPQDVTMEGIELLEFVKANPELTKIQLSLQTGYFKITPEGKQKAQASLLMDALATASGIIMADGTNLKSKTKSYKTKRHGNGILLVGKVYVDELLGAGNDCEFTIIVDKESESIVLEKI